MSSVFGSALPPGDPHGITAYIPRWRDALAVVDRKPGTLARLQAGYPRFFIPLVVRRLAEKMLRHVDFQQGPRPKQGALLFPAEVFAKECLSYLARYPAEEIVIFRVGFDGWVRNVTLSESPSRECDHRNVFVVIYPHGEEWDKRARAYWQHTGRGISSRLAEYWLENAPFLCKRVTEVDSPTELARISSKASSILQGRIAGLASTENNAVESDKVYLHQSGMSAIGHVAAALKSYYHKLSYGKDRKLSVALLGFLYVDTSKLLKICYGVNCCQFNIEGRSGLDQLERSLARGNYFDAVFTEFPGNPLGGTVDLDRLYQLRIKYGFMTVVDDSVGSPVNVSILSSCDVVCTSLTKMFSGQGNVMGGSVVVNPRSGFSSVLHKELDDLHIDAYFPLDCEVMERNSRDLEARALQAGENAERMASLLRQHPTVDKVYYPKGSPTQRNYEKHKREGGGYGHLLCVLFTQPKAAVAFHDALDLAKGPSFGTNFTLCTAHTLYSHYAELERAAEYGIVEHLVRISVGIEDWGYLEGAVMRALNAAMPWRFSESTSTCALAA